MSFAQWIKVTEDDSTLPPENVDVLCFNGNRYFVGNFSWSTEGWGETRRKKRMWCDIDSTYVRVTHWTDFARVIGEVSEGV